jgi:hypothetical protein
LLAWRQIADKYGMNRFQNALWNVLRTVGVLSAAEGD